MGSCCPCMSNGNGEEERPLIREGKHPNAATLTTSVSDSEVTGSHSPPSARPRYLQPMRMESLRIQKVDAMFERAATPFNVIVEHYARVEESNQQFRDTLQLPHSATFLECFRNIQKKLGSTELHVVYEGQFTLLSIEDFESLREDVRRATKHFRLIIDASKQLLETAPRVCEELRSCSEEARRMLDELGTLAKEAGLHMMQKLAAPKTYASNRTQLVKGPDSVQVLIGKTEELLKRIQEEAKKFDKERYQ